MELRLGQKYILCWENWKKVLVNQSAVFIFAVLFRGKHQKQ